MPARRFTALLRPLGIAAAFAAMFALAPAAQAAAGPTVRAQADAAVRALASRVPAFAASPGAAARQAPASPVATARGVVTTVRTKGCAQQAAQLRAGTITSYKCVSASVHRIAHPDVTWPSQCSSGTGELTGWLAVDRRNACDHVEIDLVVTEQPSGTVTGTADLHAVTKMSSSTTTADWYSTTYLWLWSFTGDGAPDSSEGSLFPSCSVASCLGSGDTWTTGADGESWSGTGHIVVGGLSSGVVDNNVSGFWEYNLFGAWENDVVVDNNLALNRCDNATPGTSKPGCVFGYIPAVLGFSQATVPAFVNHIYNAQLSGLPGRLSTGTYLTRLTDAALAKKNGTKACPSTGLPKPPSGYNCDEYPFRSTYEGASTSGATLARSFSFCHMNDPQRTGSKGWSRCYIPSGQNSSAGGTTGAFYTAQRMLAHDPFQIGYLP